MIAMRRAGKKIATHTTMVLLISLPSLAQY
jgi:lipoate-protein ligase A